MSQKVVDHQTARRRAAMWIFGILVFGVVGLMLALILSVRVLPGDDDFVRGIVLTAIAGAISSFLSFIGLIVKGIVDNLTRDEPT
jgi:branched-subunit amino acid ABC-type transport system permease component